MWLTFSKARTFCLRNPHTSHWRHRQAARLPNDAHHSRPPPPIQSSPPCFSIPATTLAHSRHAPPRLPERPYRVAAQGPLLRVRLPRCLPHRSRELTCSRGPPVSIDQVVSDFDGVTFHISTPETKTKILVSIHVKCYSELVQYGAQAVLEREYGPYIVAPESGYDFSVQVDLENLPEDQGMLSS